MKKYLILLISMLCCSVMARSDAPDQLGRLMQLRDKYKLASEYNSINQMRMLKNPQPQEAHATVKRVAEEYNTALKAYFASE